MPRCPVWNEGPFQRGADRQVKVGIVKDQNRVLAAHFRLHLLYRLAGHTGRRDPPRVRRSAAPTLRPGPVTKFSTTGGSPARIGISTSALALAGKRSAGFDTTQLPRANAGAMVKLGTAAGKFHGGMMPITPKG